MIQNLTVLPECDHQPYDQLSYTFRVLLFVPVLIFGLLANAINVFIFRQPRMRSSMVNWYLIALSLTDTGVLLSSFCMLSLPVLCEELGSLTFFNLGVSAQRWTYALGLSMQTASVGMTVLVSAHRFFGVVFPFRAQRWCTANRVKIAMFTVVGFSAGFNIPRWFELTIDDCQSSLFNSTAHRLEASSLRLDNDYYSWYMVILYTLFMFALPFLFLITMNTLVMRTVHRSYQLRQMLTNKVSTNTLGASIRSSGISPRHKLSSIRNGKKTSDRIQTSILESSVSCSSTNAASNNAKENKTTIMLIAVVFVFIICNSLAFINNILEVLAIHDVHGMQAYLISVEVSNFLVVINSATNIFIYWTFSARYRLLCRRYIYNFFCCYSPLAKCFDAGLRRGRRHESLLNIDTRREAMQNETATLGNGMQRTFTTRRKNGYVGVEYVMDNGNVNNVKWNGLLQVKSINRYESMSETRIQLKSELRINQKFHKRSH